MKKILNMVLILAMLALLLGAGWGIGRWGTVQYGSGPYGSGGETTATYWTTAYGSLWATAYGAQWTETYNTEIP